jgi:hypothetical protein
MYKKNSPALQGSNLKTETLYTFRNVGNTFHVRMV